MKERAEVIYPYENESIFPPYFAKACKVFQPKYLKIDQKKQ